MKTEESSDSVGDPSDNENTVDVEMKTSIEPIDELNNASVVSNTCNAADHQIVDLTNENTSSKLDNLPQPKKKGRPRKAQAGS